MEDDRGAVLHALTTPRLGPRPAVIPGGRLFFALVLGALGCSGTDAGEGGGGSGGTGTTGGSGAAAGSLSISGAGPASAGSSGAASGAGSGGAASPTAGAPSGGSGGVGTAGATGVGGSSGQGGAGGNAGAATTGGSSGSGGGASGGSAGSVAGIPIDPALRSKCTGSGPITCSIEVPNGNHSVTVELGDPAAASNSRVQSELFRISVPPTQLAAGTLAQHTFTVNVRAEKHDGYSAPGGVLNLLIDGPSPRLRGLGVAAAPSAITVFVAGDSTVCDWDPAATNISSPDQRGWAQALTQYFKPGVAVANYADSGETAGGFYGKFWPGRAAIKASDYVLVQFGHNDQKNAADISSYKTNLMRYVNDARAAGATPILISPVARKGASAGSPGFAGLDQQVRDLAAQENVTLIDLTRLSLQLYGMQTNLNSFFANNGSDGTHLSEVGAVANAGLVAQAIKAGPLPLKDYVR